MWLGKDSDLSHKDKPCLIEITSLLAFILTPPTLDVNHYQAPPLPLPMHNFSDLIKGQYLDQHTLHTLHTLPK